MHRFAFELETTEHVKNSKIPKLVHQTWKSIEINEINTPRHVMQSINAWSSGSFEYKYFLWDDEDIELLVIQEYPDLYHLYRKLTPVMRADLFRLLVLYRYGGIYSDTDTIPCILPDSWISNNLYNNQTISMIVGIETDVHVSFGEHWIDAQYVSPLQIVQWTMAASPNHPVIGHAIEFMISNLNDLSYLTIRNGDPIYLTGPGPWTFAIYKYWKDKGVDWQDLRNFGSKPRIIGDMLVLPTTAFASGTTSMFGDMGSGKPFNDATIVQHLWKGTWRKEYVKE